MGLAYQEIDVGTAIDQLSKSELPNLMAMSFVFISIAIMFAAAGWTVRAMRKTPAKEPQQIDSSVLKAMIENNATESKQRHEEMMVLSAGMNALTKKADDMSKASNTQHQSVRASIDANTAITSQTSESVTTMNEKFDNLELAIREAIEKMTGLSAQIELSPEARETLIADITNGLKSTIKECLTEAIRTTQETPAIIEPKPETPIKEEEAK